MIVIRKMRTECSRRVYRSRIHRIECRCYIRESVYF
uniref:Hypotheticial protein n=1 Tax=Schistosoma japonicum TaxID=6182 RepID=C1L6J1_SCHJA|nr:hypotheticial protein [Schistosoma japonicum]